MLHRFEIHSAFELLLISRTALLGSRIARRKDARWQQSLGMSYRPNWTPLIAIIYRLKNNK